MGKKNTRKTRTSTATSKPRTRTASKRPPRFLDTSVARPLLTASKKYREYFSAVFADERLCVSRFVKMEFRRSFLVNLIEFFFVLDMPHIESVDDAAIFWSNKFKTSQLKAILQIVSKLFETQKINSSSATEKEKALLALGQLIKRYETLLEGFTDIGRHSTRCARANVPLDVDLQNIRSDLHTFLDRFNDVKTCRDRCVVDEFLLTRNRTAVERFVVLGHSLANKTETKGFKRIAENLEEILRDGSSACSCKRCEKIGDAVIALDTPRNFSIQHTDYAFDSLCDSLGQHHQRHPSEAAVLASKPTAIASSTP
jgi:hypothetical protein